MALDRQINLFKVDTNAFFSEDERFLSTTISAIKRDKQDLLQENKILKKQQKQQKKEEKQENIEDFEQKIALNDELLQLLNQDLALYSSNFELALKTNLTINYMRDKKNIRTLSQRYMTYIDAFTNEEKANLTNIISMFESTLSRSFHIKTNELTYDIMVVEIYYYDVAKDLILNGFDYNGKHYVYFSSSAGQIRTKKAVFVEEVQYEKCKLKLMCGLTIAKINAKGGMNINKFLAYLALSNSATDLWEEVFGKPFDIDKTIVVDDFETLVHGVVDDIDYNTYKITPNIEKDIPIPHTDGCGMISSEYCKKNFMVRLPFIKGLLGSFDFKRFIREHLNDAENPSSPIIKDIWGKEHNILEENIEVIFTKSQLKMYKYYESWEEYKGYFKQYECEACVCNMEEDNISNAKINYQMLQTLYQATDEDIESLCEIPNRNIKTISDSLQNMLRFFGVHLDNRSEKNKDYYQKSLKIYPELLTDPAAKNELRDLKNSMIKKYRGGKLDVSGKFTFVLPDLYAFCEWLFCKIDIPLGLLQENQVFCQLYPNATELDCLRSPHLYIEHAIRSNTYNKKYRNVKLKEWFTTDAIYTSTYDLISRILQFDVDGDRLLVIIQPKILELAKKHMKNVRPLYYEMKKAKAEVITYENIYNGLQLAFAGGKIGGISNDITKIWNGETITKIALNAIRWLCMETNFTIDYAKTLFKPTRPQEVDDILKQYEQEKVPYFFYYAKDKTKEQVNPINDSTLNKIVKCIKDNRNMFKPIKNLAELNYLLLLKDQKDDYYNEEVNKIFDRWNKKYGHCVNFDEEDDTNKNNLNMIAQQVKEDIYKIEPDDDKIINSLVTFLYKKPSVRKKKLLWYMYGEQFYNNLLCNVTTLPLCSQCGKRTNEQLVKGRCTECRQEEIHDLQGKKIVYCVDCGKEVQIEATNRRTNRCPECDILYKRKKEREKKRKKRQK